MLLRFLLTGLQGAKTYQTEMNGRVNPALNLHPELIDRGDPQLASGCCLPPSTSNPSATQGTSRSNSSNAPPSLSTFTSTSAEQGTTHL